MNYNHFYSQSAQNYDFSRLDDGEVFESTIQYIVSHLSQSQKVILDVGCGTGKYGFKLSQLGYIVHGIDKSPHQVEIASKLIPATVGSVLSIEQKDNFYDCILMIMMIHQLDEFELNLAFKEVVRVLKPGGIVIIKTCFEDDISKRITSRYFPTCFEFDMKRFPPKDKLINIHKDLVLTNCNQISIISKIPIKILIEKFRLRGASNIGMLSEEELEQGIFNLQSQYINDEIVSLEFDNTFLVFKCCKTEKKL